MRLRAKMVATVLVLALVPVGSHLDALQSPADWNQWRGPNRDGVGDPRVLPAVLPEQLTEVWRVPVGEGYSGPVLVGETVYQFGRESGREVLRALSLADGSEMWSTSYEAAFDVESAARDHGPGPKSTPTVASGRVFTLGISGVLSAVDAGSGDVIWRHDFTDTFPQPWPIWGASMSPIVIGDRIFAHVGGDEGGAMTAFDAATGETIWANDEFTPGYASPIHVRTADTDVLFTQSNEDIIAVDASTGATLWSVRFATSAWQNAVTPVAVGESIIFSGLDMDTFSLGFFPGAGGWEAVEAWRSDRHPLYMSTPVIVDGRMFGMSHRRRGQFVCLDATTGDPIWASRGREGENAVFVALGDRVAVLTDEARLLILPAASATYEPLAEYEVASTPTWAHPAFTERGVLIKDHETLVLWSF